MKAAKINHTMALEKPLRPQLIACASVMAFATPVALSTTGAGPTLNNIDTVTAMIPMKAGGIGSKINPTTRPAKILT